MPQYFVLEIPIVTQYRYAWYQVTEDAHLSDDAPKCPACGAFTGGRYWLPPRRVELRQPRRIGDFIGGFGGSDCLMTNRAVRTMRSVSRTCLQSVFAVQVARVGTTKKSQDLPVPKLSAVDFRRSATRVLFDKMGVTWQMRPSPDFCPTCGPGGGSPRNGSWLKLERIVVNDFSWDGEDAFVPANLHGTVLVTNKMRDSILDAELTNVNIVPAEQYKVDLTSRSRPPNMRL